MPLSNATALAFQNPSHLPVRREVSCTEFELVCATVCAWQTLQQISLRSLAFPEFLITFQDLGRLTSTSDLQLRGVPK
jgi:hypothetical protein